jgi:microcystin-dependent protein
VTLLQSEIPSHAHVWNASNQAATVQGPAGQLTAGGVGGISMYAAAPPSLTGLSNYAVAPSGGDQPHNNLQPYLTLNFCIALQGVYPPRT